MRDMFIRNAMKYLENQDKELSINNIQRTMIRLAQTAKEFWMNNADKFLNNEIE
jgi:histone H3/H4